MKVKDFFRSNSFRCVAVLLGIVLACSILLTICNSLFAVTDQERLARAIAQIYGQTVEFEQLEVDDDFAFDKADLNSIYEIKSFADEYLLNVTGKDGFNNGTVTVWVVISASDGVKVKKVAVASNEGQSYIHNVTDGALSALINKQENAGFGDFNADGIKTGATRSMQAISNALNGAKAYITALKGGTL